MYRLKFFTAISISAPGHSEVDKAIILTIFEAA